MKTLVVTSRAPDARGKGDAKAADRTIRALRATGHTITVVPLAPIPLWMRLTNTARSGVSGEPLQIGFSHAASSQAELLQMAREFDLVVAIHARAAAHVPPSIRARSFAFIIDAYGQNYSTYAPALAFPKRQVYELEAERMRRYEFQLTKEFAGVGVVSDYDRDYLVKQGAEPGKVFALPGGVDIEHFATTVRSPDPSRPVFVFVGRLNYLPNGDAVNRLLSEIWPAIKAAIPNATLRIVGAQPGARLRRRIQAAGQELLADVPDVRAPMRDATALLVPMRLGGGIQSKILEAMAARVPVVCSRFANLGISATPGEHLLLAETSVDYAAHAAHLVADPGDAGRLADQAYRWVSTTQSQEAFTQHLASALDPILQRAKDTSA